MAVKAQFIAGQWLPGSGATMSKLAPEDQSLLWQAASAGADDVQAACAAARAAFYPWSHRPLAERIDVVQRFAALLETHKEALATLISRETSKPLWETRTEVQAMIGKAAISIEAYHQRTGFHESTLPDGKALLRHKPHGVMAVFGPYNFPGHLPNGHIIPALIAGNTIVFKPSELTPATAEMTVQLWQQAGIPDGAINLLQGGKATGQALLENRDIDGVLFTGSAAAGFHFHRYFGGQPEDAGPRDGRQQRTDRRRRGRYRCGAACDYPVGVYLCRAALHLRAPADRAARRAGGCAAAAAGRGQRADPRRQVG